MEDAKRLRPRKAAAPAAVATALAAVGLVVPVVVATEDGAPGGEVVPATAAVTTATAAELVASAYEAAGRDDHARAVAEALDAIQREPERLDDLALFLGHQLTWADRPAEALPWYRRHLALHPGDVEGRLGLARALSWVDDLDGASDVYAAILEEEPRHLEARLGIARMQAWRGRDRSAARAYARARELEPSSPEAALGEAKAENRLGRHRRAEELLENFETRHGRDASIHVELARARWWMGEADHALATLWRRRDEEAEGLRAAIERDRRWRLEGFASRWIDVDEQETRTTGVRAEREHSHGLAVYLEAAHSSVDEPGVEEIGAYRFVGGGSWRLDRRLALNVRGTAENVGAGLSDVDSLDAGAGEIRLGADVEGWRWRGDGWATWTPRDLTRLDLGYGRIAVDTPRSRVRDIHADVVSLGIDWGPAADLAFRTRVARADFSDDNVRTSVEFEATSGPHPVVRGGEVRVGAGAERYGFRDTPDHGYYSPSSYDALFASLELVLTLGPRVRLSGEGRLASEREESGDRFGVASGGGELRYESAGPFTFLLFARKSTSRFDTSAGYGMRGIGLAVRYAP